MITMGIAYGQRCRVDKRDAVQAPWHGRGYVRSGAQYYASPENGWAELFMHYTPDWLIVQDQQAIKNFYEGNPQGAGGIPWKAWLPSLLAWLPFLLALYLVMIASMVILRRQWMTHERLLYPLMQPSLALIAQEKGRLLPPLLRSALF